MNFLFHEFVALFLRYSRVSGGIKKISNFFSKVSLVLNAIKRLVSKCTLLCIYCKIFSEIYKQKLLSSHSISNPKEFTSKLKEFLLKNAFYSIDEYKSQFQNIK